MGEVLSNALAMLPLAVVVIVLAPLWFKMMTLHAEAKEPDDE